MPEERNPLDRGDGANPHREPLGLAAAVPDPALARALEALLTHHRHGFDLSGIDGVAAALERVRDRILRGTDLPRPRLQALADLLDGLAEPPVVTESAIPAPDPAPLPAPGSFVQALLDAAPRP